MLCNIRIYDGCLGVRVCVRACVWKLLVWYTVSVLILWFTQALEFSPLRYHGLTTLYTSKLLFYPFSGCSWLMVVSLLSTFVYSFDILQCFISFDLVTIIPCSFSHSLCISSMLLLPYPQSFMHASIHPPTKKYIFLGKCKTFLKFELS